MAKRTASPGLAWFGLALSWLIPGAGFVLFGRYSRGLTLFLIVTLTFGLGVSLHASVAWPTWSVRSEEFNLINNFTFIVQMGTGAYSALSFVSARSEAAPGVMAYLAGDPKHALYELGGYFLIVAGALNYFAVGNFHDRIVRLHPRFAGQEHPEEAQAKK